MPQPDKKRGRRIKGEKRKMEDVDDDLERSASNKRRKSTEMDDQQKLSMPLHVQNENVDGSYPAIETAFFGVLDDEEQQYFKRADDILSTNAFADAEERNLFLSNVYREADGKELKIAQSQSCSRLMERLIQLSTPKQLKNLFQNFSGNLIHLVSHRFASHCCEALLLHAAPAVTEELLQAPSTSKESGDVNGDSDGLDVSMESLYLQALGELEGHVGYLLTDRFASHVLRMLLLVLSGSPVDSATKKQLLQSRRKENTSVEGADGTIMQALEKQRTVPDSFSKALEKLVAYSIAGLDTDKLRALATHPNGNPTLQLLLKLELTHFGRQRAKDETSIIRTLLPDDPITAESGSAKFISGLVYDPVGSHLVETIIQHAPAKMFKRLYSEYFKERVPSLARNEIASYVACRVLERLGHDDLLDAHELFIPHISDLLEKNRTLVLRTLMERCTVRDIDTKAIAVQIHSTWPLPEGFEIQRLVKYDVPDRESRAPHDSIGKIADEAARAYFSRDMEPNKVHFNLLAQAMLLIPGALSSLVIDSLISLDSDTLHKMAKDQIISRTLQAAVTSRNASLITVRKLIQHFYGSMGEMAIDTAASHVVDCIWEGTHGLAFIRERIAEELAENEAQLRDSPCGRMVWKNWKMDLYKRRRADWVKQSKVKASNDGFQSFAELEINKEKDVTAKTPLQLARERHADAKRKGKDKKRENRRTSAVSATTQEVTNATATAPT